MQDAGMSVHFCADQSIVLSRSIWTSSRVVHAPGKSKSCLWFPCLPVSQPPCWIICRVIVLHARWPMLQYRFSVPLMVTLTNFLVIFYSYLTFWSLLYYCPCHLPSCSQHYRSMGYLLLLFTAGLTLYMLSFELAFKVSPICHCIFHRPIYKFFVEHWRASSYGGEIYLILESAFDADSIDS